MPSPERSSPLPPPHSRTAPDHRSPRPPPPAAPAPATGAGTRPGAAARAAIQRALDDIARSGTPGVLATLDDRGSRWTGEAGVADLRTGRERQARDHFRIGSITKSYMATVILQLEAEGVLDLDDTVERWLPGVVTGNGHDGSAITVRLLPPAQQKELTTAVAADPAVVEDGACALGIHPRTLSCGVKVWGHTGGTTGSGSEAFITADGKRSLVTNVNGNWGRPGPGPRGGGLLHSLGNAFTASSRSGGPNPPERPRPAVRGRGGSERSGDYAVRSRRAA